MGECVVVGCVAEGTVIVGKPTVWGAWEYRVCQPHKDQVDVGAAIDDQSDGRTIILRPRPEPAASIPPIMPSTSEIQSRDDTSTPDLVAAFADVANEMAEAAHPATARQVVVSRAWTALGSAGAALWQLTPAATMALDSFTDATFMQLMTDIVGRQPDGPAWQAMQERRTTVAVDFETETRWPNYTQRLVSESAVRSAVVYPLGLSGQDLGVLAVYSHQRGYFTPSLVEFGALFAACASLALENASLADRSRHMEIALKSNRRIGMAIGILMSRHQLTETQAFNLLRVASNNTNVKLAAVADEVILTGTVATLMTR